MKVVFLGTSIFALPSIRALYNSEDIELVMVVSRPDRRCGRGRKISRPPVAVLADQLGIKLLQPEKLREIKDLLEEISPDVMVSASYGGWLPGWFLAIAPLGVVNIHPSLLPAHRGAAPVIRAVLHGDKETGVCFMKTDEGWDTGDILHTVKRKMEGNQTAGELEKTLSESAAEVLPWVLGEYLQGEVVPVPQSGAESYAEKVTPEETFISWQNSAEEVRRMILAFNPVPGARTLNRSKILKIYSSEVFSMKGIPGQVLETAPLVIGCGEEALKLLEVQPEGKRRMSSEEFVRGYRIMKGALLSEK